VTAGLLRRLFKQAKGKLESRRSVAEINPRKIGKRRREMDGWKRKKKEQVEARYKKEKSKKKII
jgi:hypothetical protein